MDEKKRALVNFLFHHPDHSFGFDYLKQLTIGRLQQIANETSKYHETGVVTVSEEDAV